VSEYGLDGRGLGLGGGREIGREAGRRWPCFFGGLSCLMVVVLVVVVTVGNAHKGLALQQQQQQQQQHMAYKKGRRALCARHSPIITALHKPKNNNKKGQGP